MYLNPFFMKKLIFAWVPVVVLLLLLQTNSFSQACPPKGKCEGDCAPWYFRNAGTPVLAGTPTCHKIKGECHCVLLHTALGCNDTNLDGGKKPQCEGPCPPVFATQQDAINNTNPIEGTCITQRTGNATYCACEYIR